jgi:hypothetical protein
MKKLVAVILAMMMVTSLGACGSNDSVSSTNVASTAEQATVAPETQEVTKDTSKEDELTADMAALEAIGEVEVENGILTVSITMPKDFVTKEISQEKLDADAGDNYLSAKLNQDGSVTYKLTKAQHRAMLDAITEGMEESFQEMIKDESRSFKEIKHNETYSVFDVTMDTDTVGLGDSFTVLAFYMYGGLYGIFSGNKVDNVIVNFYDPAGNLIESGNSAETTN